MKAARKPRTEKEIQGDLCCPKRPHVKCPGLREGSGTKNRNKAGHVHFSLISFILLCLSSTHRTLRVPIQGNRGGRERPPPKAGGHVAPIAALVGHASIRPHAGSLSSLSIPAGRLGTGPNGGADGREKDL